MVPSEISSNHLPRENASDPCVCRASRPFPVILYLYPLIFASSQNVVPGLEGTCKKMQNLSLTLDLQNHNLHFNRILQVTHRHMIV